MGTFFPHTVSSIFRLSLTHTHTHTLSLSICLSISPPPSPPLSLSLSFFLCKSLSLPLYLSLSLSVFLRRRVFRPCRRDRVRERERGGEGGRREGGREGERQKHQSSFFRLNQLNYLLQLCPKFVAIITLLFHSLILDLSRRGAVAKGEDSPLLEESADDHNEVFDRSTSTVERPVQAVPAWLAKLIRPKTLAVGIFVFFTVFSVATIGFYIYGVVDLGVTA